MAYDEGLAQRVREMLAEHSGITEKKMFGGIAFLLRGNMCCGVVGDDLMVRVGPGAYEDSLRLPAARPMDFTGRPMKGFVFVGPDGYESDDDLDAWVTRGAGFALSLPAK